MKIICSTHRLPDFGGILWSNSGASRTTIGGAMVEIEVLRD